MSDESLPQSDARDGARHPRETYTLFGQSSAETQFLNSLQAGRLHHAWMLTGPEGVGKATLAWRITRFILAHGLDQTATSLDMSPDDPISRRIESLAEPRFALIRRPYDVDKKKLKTQITVDEIRKLKSFFQLSSADGGWRVAIIDAADELNGAAANALLKILEEPPERSLILLIAHQPGRLLPTILSRCSRLPCADLSEEDMTHALQDQGLSVGANPHHLFELADGSVGRAVDFLNNEGLELYHSIAKIFETLPSLDRAAVLQLAERATGPANANRYDMMLTLLRTYLARLAKFAALQPSSMTEAAPHEARNFARLGPSPKTAQTIAETLNELEGKSEHARLVNLDPSSVILDMFLTIQKRI